MAYLFSIVLFLALIIYGITAKPKKKPKAKTYDTIYLLRLGEVKRRAEARGDTATVQAVLDMTYDGSLPIMKPDHTFVAEGASVISFPIAGINYQRGIKNYLGAFSGYIKPEPHNKYDQNAISVHASDTHRLGYIPAIETYNVRDLIGQNFPYPIWGKIEEHYDDIDYHHYYQGLIYIEIKPNVSPLKL